MSEAKTKEKRSNKLIIILLIFTLLIVLSAGGFFAYLFFFSGSGASNTTFFNKTAKEKTYQLDEFVVNLADEKTTYLKLTIALGYEEKKLDKELPEKVAAIRDTINSALRSKTSIDFSGNGTETVKKELLDTINKKLSKGKITNIYLSDIIIQ